MTTDGQDFCTFVNQWTLSEVREETTCMLETEVILDFSCCDCHHAVYAKLKCSGTGVAAGPHAVTCVDLTCPHCQSVNQVYFELSGMVLQVAEKSRHPLLEPSLN